MNYFQLLILLIIIFVGCIIIYTLLLHNRNTSIEGYDARISGIGKEMCGKFCTETFGCIGFGFDHRNNRCYLSEKPILFQTSSSIYSNEYEVDNFRCNKINPIRPDLNEIENVDEDMLRMNTIYLCQDDEEDIFKYNKVVNGIIEPIKESDNAIDTQVNTFPDVKYEEYPLYKINWPIYKKDLDINKLYNENTNKLNDYIVFQKDNMNFYEGEYLYPYRCVNNISEDVCVKTCSDNENCVGVEYNPLYVENKDNATYKVSYNVCCPKKTISKINVRSKPYLNGHFNRKIYVNELPKNDIYRM